MALPSALDFKIKFDRTNNPPNFELEDLTDYATEGIALVDVRGCFTSVVDPISNTIYANTNFSSPDIQPSLSLLFTGITIPTDINNEILEGQYSFNYDIKVDDPIIAVNTGSKTFTVAGNRAARITSSGSVTMVRSTGNNGSYTVVSAIFGGVDTVVTVSEVIPDGTVDGSLQYQDQEVYSKNKLVTYNDIVPAIAINVSVDCFCGIYTSTDNTSYGPSATILSRTHTVFYPAALEIAPIVSANQTVVVTPIYTKTWTTKVESTVSYDLGGGNTIEVTIVGEKDIVVDCDLSLCEISCGVTALNNKYKNALVNNPSNAPKYFSQLTRVFQLIDLFKMQQECGKNTEASTTLSEIRTAGEFTEDCSCDDSEMPQQIVPMCGGGAGNVAVTAGTGITVTTTINGNTASYEVSLSSAYITLLNSLAPVNVVGGTGINVVKTVVGGVDTYTVANTSPYTESNFLEFRSNVEYSNFTSPTVSIATGSILKTGSNMDTGVTVESVGFVSNPNWVNINNLFKVSGFQVAGNDQYKVVIDSVANGYYSVVGTTLVDTIAANQMHLLGKLYSVEILNQTNSEFYFRVVDANGVPITNRKMTAFPSIIFNIKISE